MSKVRIEDKKSALPPECASNVVSKNEIKYPPNSDSIAYKPKKSSTLKKRNWATVVYPESAPENWIELLTLSGVQSAISPLHDKDINPDEHEKKPHWHVILTYGSPTTQNNVKGLCDRIGGVGQIALDSVRGYYRYLTHQDSPEKFQYDVKDIKTLNGFSILDFIELTRTEIIKIKKELLVLINTENFFEYADFIDYLQDKGTDEFLDVGMSNTYFFDKYLTSRRHKAVPIKKVSGSISGLVKEANS